VITGDPRDETSSTAKKNGSARFGLGRPGGNLAENQCSRFGFANGREHSLDGMGGGLAFKAFTFDGGDEFFLVHGETPFLLGIRALMMEWERAQRLPSRQYNQ
jgi:hypothetical protein